jgi:hypothetical protein
MPPFPALQRQRQTDLCEFEASLDYKGGSRITRDVTQRNPASKPNNYNKKTIKVSSGFFFAFIIIIYVFIYSLIFWFFETGFLCIALAVLELTL